MVHLIRLAGLAVLLLSNVFQGALAAEFYSLAEPAVMYDAPSDKGKRLYIIQRYTPVEVVVNLEGWTKVRDAEGSIAWVQKAFLSQTRMVVATTLAQVRQTAETGAPVLFQVDRMVAMELLEAGPPGWARVRHRDGQEGYARIEQLWGL